jgi:4-amino-4-deoxy-L-arabinose transferase-like glycosyltransferase
VWSQLSKVKIQQQRLVIALTIFFIALAFRTLIAYLKYSSVGSFIGDIDDFLYYQTAARMSDSYLNVFAKSTDLFWCFSLGYPLILSLLFKVFGADPIVAVGTNIFLGSLTVSLFYLFAERILRGEFAAVSAAGMLLVLPVLIWDNIMILSDTIFLFFLLSASFFYFRALRSKKSLDLCLLYLFVALTVLVRYEGLLLFVVLGVHAFITSRSNLKGLIVRWETAFGVILLLALLAPQLLYNATHHGGPFVTGYAYWNGKEYTPEYSPTIPVTVVNYWNPIMGLMFMRDIFQQLLYHLFSPQFLSPLLILWVIAGSYSLLSSHNRRQETVFLSLWFAVWILLYSLYYPGTFLRYTLIISLAPLLLASEGISHVGVWITKNRKISRPMIDVGISVLALLATILPQAYLDIIHVTRKRFWFMAEIDSSRWLGVGLGSSFDFTFSIFVAIMILAGTTATAIKLKQHR